MERGDASNFTRLGTLGIEEEFFVVDDDARPTAGTDTLVYEAEPPAILGGRLDHELFKFVIETQTPTIEDPANARDRLLAVRNALIDHAEAHGYRIAAAGLHPAAKWYDLEHAEKERYRAQLDRIQYPQHRNTTAGLHIHVGVDDADKAVWVANELRWHQPLLLALSVNSPFWCGIDTGLASARAKIFEALPNTGMPTAFDSYKDFDRFERRMLETDSIEDRGELWYDVRPHSGLGTVEVRVPDAQRDPEVVLTFVEYVRAAVLDLAARYEDGESSSRYRRELLDESKWRAMRYGHDAALLTRDMTETRPLAELVEAEAARLNVPDLGGLAARESRAAAQRRLRAAEGLDGLCESLVLERT